MSPAQHCSTCRCYESPTPEPVAVGQWVKNRLTNEIGQVKGLTLPNPPWHNGGTPEVWVAGEHAGYWHYYDIVDEF